MTRRFHPDARAEYVAALLEIEEHRAGYGEKFETEVFAVLGRAAEFPRSGARVDGYPVELDLRTFPLRLFRYTLFIAFGGGDVVVYAVAHQHREPGYWRDRLTPRG